MTAAVTSIPLRVEPVCYLVAVGFTDCAVRVSHGAALG